MGTIHPMCKHRSAFLVLVDIIALMGSHFSFVLQVHTVLQERGAVFLHVLSGRSAVPVLCRSFPNVRLVLGACTVLRLGLFGRAGIALRAMFVRLESTHRHHLSAMVTLVQDMCVLLAIIVILQAQLRHPVLRGLSIRALAGDRF